MYLFYNLLDEYFIISATSLALALAALRRVRRQRRVPALRREDLRGLQGLLQENCAEERQVRLSGGQELPRGQAEEEPVPVLQVPEVSRRRHGQGGCSDRLSQGSERSSSNKAPGERQ